MHCRPIYTSTILNWLYDDGISLPSIPECLDPSYKTDLQLQIGSLEKPHLVWERSGSVVETEGPRV